MKQEQKKTKKEVVNFGGNGSFLGVFVVIFGLIIMLNSLNIISINVDMWMIWPIFVIFLGLSLFTRKDNVSLMVGSVVSLIVIILMCISFFNPKPVVENKELSMPIIVSQEMEIEKAKIEINAGMGDISLYGLDTMKLVEGNILSNFAKTTVNSSLSNNIQDVKIDIDQKNEWKDNPKNELKLGLNKNIPVDLIFNSGASSNSLDLSEVMAESISVSTGASSLNLKIGDLIDNPNVSIEAGASSIIISLPQTMEGKIIFESALSSKELNKFNYVGDNIYKTTNYDTATKRADITIKTGMASVVVNWYEPISKKIVELYYYKASDDKEVSCDSDFVLPVERSVINNEDIIKNTIELLIQGNLTQSERNDGFETEFPNIDFKLLNAELSDKGTLTLTFTEVPGFTTGGSCRTGLLAAEIIKTAKQFKEVRKVVLEPESLFEP